METAKQKRSVDTHKAEKGKWDRMPKSCLDTEFIHSDLFSRGSYNFLCFCFKETHAWFLRRLFLYFVRGGDLPVSVWDTRYPEHVAVRRSVNGGLVRDCFSVTPSMAVCMRGN